MAETHAEVIERFQSYWDADRDNREDGIDDQRFLALDQWPEPLRRQREAEGRPCVTVDRLNAFVKQVSGNLRKSAPAIDAFPVDSKTDPVIAEIYSGLIRQIEYQSKAKSAYSWGAQCSIGCGIGHWRVDTRYVEDGFDQEICIKRIMDPFAVIWDPDAQELDRSDAFDCFVTEWITEDAYYRRYPDQLKDGRPSDIPSDSYHNGLFWRDTELIRIASRWFKVPKKRKLGMTQDGQIFELDKLPKVAIQSLGITREREIDGWEIKHQAISGDDFLTDEESWAGRHIPIIPCIGDEVTVDGTVSRRGIVRSAKDPQRLYNYWRSASAETIAMQPKAPWVVTANMIKGREGMWMNANRSNLPVLIYSVDSEAPQLSPERAAPPAPPAALWQEAQIAEGDMKATTGIYDAALGNRSNETSGKAIEERQQQSDNGSFLFFDNFEVAITRTGQVLVDLIPKIYDGERTLRILGVDEVEGFVPINKTVMGPYGPELVNDITTGKFDVRVKMGPSYATARQEARTQLTQIMANQPELMNVMGDIFFENMDFAGANKMAERMKKVIPPQITGEGQEQPDPAAQAVQQLQIAGAEAEVHKKQAEAFDKEQSGIGKAIDNAAKQTQIAQYGVEPPQHVMQARDQFHELNRGDREREFQAEQGDRDKAFQRDQGDRDKAFQIGTSRETADREERRADKDRQFQREEARFAAKQKPKAKEKA